MDKHEQGQVAATAAQVYEDFFVPSLFSDWPSHVLQQAKVSTQQKILDVACGTGVLARTAIDWIGQDGQVDAIDINEGMLAVARSKHAGIHWHLGNAESLPFSDAQFDRVVSQFGLMFFEDKVKAISEMRRVMKSEGLGCVAVWGPLADTPGYLAVENMLSDIFGADVAKSIQMPYCLGDIERLESLFKQARCDDISIKTITGKARFDSIDSWLYTDIKGWTLADVIDDQGYKVLQLHAESYLGEFINAQGQVMFDAPAHLVVFN